MSALNFSLPDHLDLIATAPGGIQKLRGLILELAVRGKLVPQDAADEPAGELLKRISLEKAQLESAKVIRRSKPFPLVSRNEQIFPLPLGWEWIRLGQIGDWGAGATPSRTNSSYYGGSIPWFKSGELSADFIHESEESITSLALKECSLRQNKAGDVLIAMYGATIGKAAILARDATTNQAVCACTPSVGVFNRYLLLLLKALKPNFIGQGAGGAQPNISREKIIATVAALPSETEQHRIVAKVDELMALCDRLEAEQADAESAHARIIETLLGTLTQSADADELAANWQRLAEHFDSLFVTRSSVVALRKTVLDLAVEGRLVTQFGHAELCSLSSLIEGDSLNGCSKRPSDTPGETQILRISAGTGKDHFFVDESDHKWVDAMPAEIEKFRLLPDDLLACRFNGNLHYVGSFSLYRGGTGVVQVFPDKLIRFRVRRNKVLPHYLRYALNASSVRVQVESFCATTVGNIGISATNLKTVKVRVPELDEQHRIVAKVDELMAICDRLKADLVDARTRQARLADTLIDAALAAA